jgi:3'-5' exoribonuclease
LRSQGAEIMEKQFVNGLKINDKVDSCFVLRKKSLKLTKYDKPYLDITFEDKTGKIEGRMWDDAEKFNSVAVTGDVVLVKGSVEKYKEEKQIKIDFLEKADDRAFKFEDMVRIVENRDKIYFKVFSYLKDIKNPHIRALAKKFEEDEVFIRKFKDALGAKSWHNAYIGGLLEHTYEVMYIVDCMCTLYPDVARDIALFGAFIHDIGKVYELDEKKMEYTVEGGLLGHIAIGYRLLSEKVALMPDFPEDLKLLLGHIILSHHGEYEQQSPVLPKTLEAIIVYQTDELVSQTNAVKEIQRAQAEEGRVWSDFVHIKSRKFYIKETAKEEPKKDTAKGPSKKPEDARPPKSDDEDLF